jgi:hypothetical protein
MTVAVAVVVVVVTGARKADTDRQAENSDVAPVALFVAVVVSTSLSPNASAAVVKLVRPAPSVCRLSDPRGVWPSPKPDGSQLGLAKKRSVKPVFAVEASVPVTVAP